MRKKAPAVKPCPLCGVKLRKKITVRKEVVYDHPRNGCKHEWLRVRSYAVTDWNSAAESRGANDGKSNDQK